MDIIPKDTRGLIGDFCPADEKSPWRRGLRAAFTFPFLLFLSCSSYICCPQSKGGVSGGLDPDAAAGDSARRNKNLTQIYEQYLRKTAFFVWRKCLKSLISAHEKWEQHRRCCIYIFVRHQSTETLPEGKTMSTTRPVSISIWVKVSSLGLSLVGTPSDFRGASLSSLASSETSGQLSCLNCSMSPFQDVLRCYLFRV